MRNDRRRNSKPGVWMSNEEFDELVGAVQTALGVARIARRILAEADDKVAEVTSIMHKARNRMKQQAAPKREQVL